MAITGSFPLSTINVPPHQPQTEQNQRQAVLLEAQTLEQRSEQRSSSSSSLQNALVTQARQTQGNSNVPEVEDGMAPFPKTVEAWQAAISAQKQRPIDKASAAEVLNQIRFNPHAPNALAGKIPSHKELKTRITSGHEVRWNAALGLSAAEIKAMNDMAFWGGTTVPLNNTFFNAISFALVPMLQYLSNNMKSPWAQAGVGLAVAAAQPILNSVVQTPAVASLEVWRQKNAPSVQLDKDAINAKKTPRDLANDIGTASQQLRESNADLNRLMRTLAQTYGITVPKEGSDLDQTHLEQILTKATPEAKAQLSHLHQQNTGFLMNLGELVVGMQKADGGQDRAKHLSAWQIIPRSLRGASRLPSAVLTGYAAEYVKNLKQPLSPIQISGVSIAVAMGCQLGQHLAAGFDEVAGQSHDHKMNMLHADVFTPEGKTAWERGESILPEHLDEKKLRGLVELPATQMAKRVAKLIEGRLNDAQKSLQSKTAAGHVDTSTADLETGGVAAGGTIQHRIAELQADLELLRNGNLTDLSPEGEASELVNGVMKDFAVGHAVKESSAKMTPMEFSAQLAQRLAQSFTFGVGGSTAAVTAGPVLTAFLGGNDKVPNGAKVGISIGNMVVAAFAAVTQYMVVNVKNNRRDGGDMGFFNQVWQGVISPIITAKDYLASGRGLKTAEETFNDSRRVFSEALDSLIEEAQGEMPGAWLEDEPEPPASLEAQLEDVDAITPAPLRS